MSFKHTFLDGSVLRTQDFTVKHYKTLLKRCYGEINDHLEFVEDLAHILAEYSESEVSFWTGKHLYDVALFLINLRSAYVGDMQQFKMASSDTTVSVDLLLPTVADKIALTFWRGFGQPLALEKNCTGILQPPSIEFLVNNPNFSLAHSPLELLHSVVVKSKPFALDSTSRDLLPAKMSRKVGEKIQEWTEDALSTNLLPEGCTEKVVFVPSPPFFCQLVKLLFMEDLEGFYSNIFHLSRLANMSPTYIESCAPGEYLLFVKKLEFLLSEQKQDQSQSIDLGVDRTVEEP